MMMGLSMDHLGCGSLGESLAARCDLGDTSPAIVAQRGLAWGSDQPQEGKAQEEPSFLCPGVWRLSQL